MMRLNKIPDRKSSARVAADGSGGQTRKEFTQRPKKSNLHNTGVDIVLLGDETGDCCPLLALTPEEGDFPFLAPEEGDLAAEGVLPPEGGDLLFLAAERGDLAAEGVLGDFRGDEPLD